MPMPCIWWFARVMMAAPLCPFALAPSSAHAQTADLLVPDSTNDRIMLFDGFDGSLIDANFITDTAPGFPALSTPKKALAVGDEIWVVDQITDAVNRYSYDGTQFLGTFTTLAASGVDNMRGIEVVGDRVYISCGLGTLQRNVNIFDRATGTLITSVDYDASALTGTPYDVRLFNGRILIGDDRDDLYIMDLDGGNPAKIVDSVGSPGNPLEFPQHVWVDSDGQSFLSGSFFAPGGGTGQIVRFDATGGVIESFTLPAPATGVRAVARLGNGHLFATMLVNASTQPHPIVIRDASGSVTYPHDALGVIDAQFVGLRPRPTVACNPADITDTGDTGAGPDGQLNLDDILAFVNEYNDATGCPGAAPCNRADITDTGDTGAGPDGQLSLDDILAFVNAYNEGC